jgi:hypothetical protein
MKQELIQLYEQMSEHTKGECAHSCRRPHSCCSREYCAMALEIAFMDGVILEVTSHPTLPFMGENGCTVPPHYRPNCTLHTCAVNGFGFKPGDEAWTEKYFQIRGQIEVSEFE